MSTSLISSYNLFVDKYGQTPRGLLINEFNVLFTNLLIRGLNVLGSGRTGCVLRALLLRLLGYSIGKNVRLASDIYIHKRFNNVEIGDGSFVNKGVHFDSRAKVKIGQHCDVGYNTVFATSTHSLQRDFKARRPASATGPIIVEDFVWIGGNVFLVGGVTIGRGSVIAAGSIVTKDVPPNCLAMGSPAKVIRELMVQ